MALNSSSYWDSDVVDSFLHHEGQLVVSSIALVSFLKDKEGEASARVAAENTAERLLDMLHDGRLAFEDMRATVQADEAVFFNGVDYSGKYFEIRDELINERKQYTAKLLLQLNQQPLEQLEEKLSDLCTELLQELDYVVGEINAVHIRRKKLEKMK